MSDLETTGSLGQNAATITPLALGKLRSLATSGGVPVDNIAMFDAFAEVFASMAVASPVPASQTSNPPTNDDLRDASVNESSEPNPKDDADARDSSDSVENHDLNLDQGIVNVAIETVQPAEDEFHAEPTESPEGLAPANEQLPDGQVAVTPLVVEPEAETPKSTESPKSTETPVATLEHQGQRPDNRRDEQPVQDTDGPARGSEKPSSTAPIVGSSEVESNPAEVGLQSDTEDDSQDHRRQLPRGRRAEQSQRGSDSHAAKEPADSSAARNRADLALAGIEREGAAAQQLEPTPSASPTTAAPRPVAATVAAAITAAQPQVAASATSGSSSANAVGNRLAGNRFSAPIDPSAPDRSIGAGQTRGQVQAIEGGR